MTSRWSLWSRNSLLSIASTESVLSIGSTGSALSIGSVCSFASLGSLGSAMSLASAGSFQSRCSLLSGQSDGSVLSWQSSLALRGRRTSPRAMGTRTRHVPIAATGRAHDGDANATRPHRCHGPCTRWGRERDTSPSSNGRLRPVAFGAGIAVATGLAAAVWLRAGR